MGGKPADRKHHKPPSIEVMPVAIGLGTDGPHEWVTYG